MDCDKPFIPKFGPLCVLNSGWIILISEPIVNKDILDRVGSGDVRDNVR